VAGRLGWVHSASTSLLSLFTVHPKRGKVAMDQAGVLPGFGGVAVHDGWAPYWRYDVTHALCGAHYPEVVVMPRWWRLPLVGGVFGLAWSA